MDFDLEKQLLIKKIYKLSKELLDNAVKDYSKSEQDLWSKLVTDAQNNDMTLFIQLTAGTNITPEEYAAKILQKDAILDPYRIAVMNWRNLKKTEIMTLPNDKNAIREYNIYEGMPSL